MAWSTLSGAQVLSEGGFSNTEKTQLTTLAGTGGAALADVLANIIQTVRGVCSAAGVTLGAASTIPDSLRMDVIAIIRWRWLIGFPQLKSLQTDERKTAAEKAEERLDNVAAGTRPVEDGANATPAGSPSIIGASAVTTARTRQITDDNTDGM